MRQFFSIYIILCLLSFHDTKADEGDIIRIVFAGSSVSVDIPVTANVTASIDGANVSLVSQTTTEEYVYCLTGSTDNGSLRITGAYKLTLELAGVDITSQAGAAIDIETGKRVAVVIGEGTVNSIEDCEGGGQKAAMYFSGHPEFEGGGILNVRGNTKHAVSAKEYMQLKKSTGTINILSAVGDGLHCGKGKPNNEHRYFRMDGGVVNLTGIGDDGIDSDDYGVMYLDGGVINANVSQPDGKGLKCDSIIYLTGTTLNLNVTGTGSVGMQSNFDMYLSGGRIEASVSGSGAKAVKGNYKAIGTGTVAGGGFVSVSGTDMTIWLHADDYVENDSNTVKVRALSSDQYVLRNAGAIEVFAYGQMGNAVHGDLGDIALGGTLTVHRAPWVFYYGDFQYDMRSYLQLYVDGVQVTDFTNYAIGIFNGDQCCGVALDDYLRIHSNSTDADPLYFRVYDYTSETEYEPTASKQLTFSSDLLAAPPNDPVILNLSTLKGDINYDGKITIADVTALVDIILGKDSIRPYIYNHTAADVNIDSRITIADVTALVDIILGK